MRYGEGVGVKFGQTKKFSKGRRTGTCKSQLGEEKLDVEIEGWTLTNGNNGDTRECHDTNDNNVDTRGCHDTLQ